jgi:hypothetical protein
MARMDQKRCLNHRVRLMRSRPHPHCGENVGVGRRQSGWTASWHSERFAGTTDGLPDEGPVRHGAVVCSRD